MAEQDFEPSSRQNDDTFDVEITNLDAAGQATTETAQARTEASAAPSPVPAPASRSGLRSRWTMRQRLLQFVVTTMIALLLLSIFLGSSASMRNVLIGFLHPTPTPLPPGESDFFYVQGNPLWGQLFIDGQRVAHLPLVGEPPLRLQRGLHMLRWQASPFEPLSCTISVPAGGNTCLAHAVPVNAKTSAWLITFNVSLANLPANQRAALIHSTRATLDAMQSTDTVRPGELYAVASPGACRSGGPTRYCAVTAQELLRATLSFTLDTLMPPNNATCISGGLSNSCLFQQQDCRLFCAFPALLFHASPAFSTGWNVFVVVRSSWTYALPDGRVIARDQPDSFLDSEQGNEYFIAMQIRWDGASWQVMPEQLPFLSSPTCTEVENEVDMGGFLGGVALPFPLTWNFASAATPSVGCLGVASATQQTNTTPLPSNYPLPGAYCLQRFGVLLAANAAAHRYWPYLPLADSYEQNLAHQLAIQLAENL